MSDVFLNGDDMIMPDWQPARTIEIGDNIETICHRDTCLDTWLVFHLPLINTGVLCLFFWAMLALWGRR